MDTLDYKIQQDKRELDFLTEKISEQENDLGLIKREIAKVKPVKSSFDEIAAIGRKKRFGNKVEMTSEEFQKLQSLAQEGITARTTIHTLNQQIYELKRRIWSIKDELDNFYEKTRDFRDAVRLAPERVKELFTDIFQKAKKAKEQRKA